MAEDCTIHIDNVADAEEVERRNLRIDSKLWQNLSENLGEIEREEFCWCFIAYHKNHRQRDKRPFRLW